MVSGISFAIGSATTQAPSIRQTNGSSTAGTQGTKRSHASLGDDSDEEATPVKQKITHFGSKGAYDVAAPKDERKPLIIKPQANRDWRDASKETQAKRRAKYGIPVESASEQAKTREAEIKRLEDAQKPVYGLNVFKNKGQTNGDSHEEHEGKDNRAEPSAAVTVVQDAPLKPRTDDERAMDALLGVKHTSDLTIPAANEQEAFERDYKSAPDVPTLEEYAAVPVEEFGAALLRGMGWKEGHGIGNQRGQKIQKAKVPQRRPALLGIGAKEDAAVKEEIGAWGRGAKKGAVPQVYNPIVMRNKQTGEELTEEELNAKLEAQKIKDKDAELDALASRQKNEEREARKREERRRRDEYSEEKYERRRRDKRREKDRDREGDDRDSGRRERRRSRDGGRDGAPRQDRHRDVERREQDRRRDKHYRDDRDDRDRRKQRDYKDDRYDEDRRRRR